MSIETILQFQTADIKLFKLENELKNSEEFKKIALIQKNLHEYAETLKKFEGEAAEILASYDRISDSVIQAEKSVKELIGAVDEMNAETEEGSLGEYEFYLKKLEKANEVLGNNEKEIAKTKKRIEEIVLTSTKLLRSIFDYTERKKNATVEFDKLRNEKKGDADNLMKEIARLKGDLPQGVLEAYTVIRNEKRLPAFVKLVNKNQCQGCGMDVPSETLTKLKTAGDFTECPNCKRFLYHAE
ncbi:MAG: C4-type zinc ribbon domain-containing protein [Clostridiales bacterium]|jgi:predicted  nucleic acid-binding Zn-ribbon protein|nr:C4-type zinc ribbon domain-containing protein [Clostridiales bacterium]